MERIRGFTRFDKFAEKSYSAASAVWTFGFKTYSRTKAFIVKAYNWFCRNQQLIVAHCMLNLAVFAAIVCAWDRKASGVVTFAGMYLIYMYFVRRECALADAEFAEKLDESDDSSEGLPIRMWELPDDDEALNRVS